MAPRRPGTQPTEADPTLDIGAKRARVVGEDESSTRRNGAQSGQCISIGLSLQAPPHAPPHTRNGRIFFRSRGSPTLAAADGGSMPGPAKHPPISQTPNNNQVRPTPAAQRAP
eukprot:scaffold10101_cov105-Isochrysis_galbana.AAC.4